VERGEEGKAEGVCVCVSVCVSGEGGRGRRTGERALTEQQHGRTGREETVALQQERER
jgi:hypothetical protein